MTLSLAKCAKTFSSHMQFMPGSRVLYDRPGRSTREPLDANARVRASRGARVHDSGKWVSRAVQSGEEWFQWDVCTYLLRFNDVNESSVTVHTRSRVTASR